MRYETAISPNPKQHQGSQNDPNHKSLTLLKSGFRSLGADFSGWDFGWQEYRVTPKEPPLDYPAFVIAQKEEVSHESSHH